MRKPKLPPGTPDDIEAAFYDALQHADIDRLMACWADEDDIVCVHPGGPRLLGHEAIRATFEAMFANGSVMAMPEKLHRHDDGHCAVHSVVERVAVLGDDGPRHAFVLATSAAETMTAHQVASSTAEISRSRSPKGSMSSFFFRSFSISATNRASLRATNVTAKPDAPARPVRAPRPIWPRPGAVC